MCNFQRTKFSKETQQAEYKILKKEYKLLKQFA